MCGAGQWAIKDAVGRVSTDRFGSREDAEEGVRERDTNMPHASPHVAICMKEGA